MVDEWVVKYFGNNPNVEKDRYSTTYLQWKSKTRIVLGDPIAQDFQAYKYKGKYFILNFFHMKRLFLI